MNKFIYGVYDKIREIIFSDRPNMFHYDPDSCPPNISIVAFKDMSDVESNIDIQISNKPGAIDVLISINKDELNIVNHCDDKTIVAILNFYDIINEVFLPKLSYKSNKISYQSTELKLYSIIECIKTICRARELDTEHIIDYNKYINQLGSNLYNAHISNPINEVDAIVNGYTFNKYNTNRFVMSNLVYNVFPMMVTTKDDDTFDKFKNELEKAISLKVKGCDESLSDAFNNINDEVIILINHSKCALIKDGQVPLSINIDINDKGLFVINDSDVSIDNPEIDNDRIIKSIIYSLKPNIGMNEYTGERVVNSKHN